MFENAAWGQANDKNDMLDLRHDVTYRIRMSVDNR